MSERYHENPDVSMTPAGRLRLGLASMVLLTVVGTIGYRVIEPGFTLFDGFYMTLITVSTVGFTEVHALTLGGRVFTSGLILVGIVLVAFSTGSFIELVVQGELGRYFGRRRLDRKISSLHDHWIVCGFGRMGRHVAHELTGAKRGPEFVVVERDPERTATCEQRGYLYVLGDASQDHVLEAAGIQRAAGVVSVVATDADNVFICLTARGIRSDLRIIARAAEEGSEAKLRRAGANKVIAPYHVGGLRLSHAILRPAVQDFLDFAMGPQFDIELEEVTVRESSSLVGLTLEASPLRARLDLILLAIRRANDEMRFNPDSKTQILAGDTLVAVGAAPNLRELEQLCDPSPNS